MTTTQDLTTFIKEYLVLRKHQQQYFKFKQKEDLGKCRRLEAVLDNKAINICIDLDIPLSEIANQPKLF